VGEETNLVEQGIITREEIGRREALLTENPDATPRAVVNRELATAIIRQRPPPAADPDEPAPRFAVGDPVRARNVHPAGHTRLPHYTRGKRGVIERVNGAYPLPDAVAHGRGPDRQPVYGVCFDARELWGDSAEPGETLSIDLWESYLEPL